MAPINNQTEARILALEDAVKDIRDAVVTIARLEERHVETREAINRCFAGVEKQSYDVAALRVDIDHIKRDLVRVEGRLTVVEELRSAVMRGVWSLVGLVGLAVAGLVFVK